MPKCRKRKINAELFQKLSKVLTSISKELDEKDKKRQPSEADETLSEAGAEEAVQNENLEKDFIGTFAEAERTKNMFATSTLIPNFLIAKGFLMRLSKAENTSVYDHVLDLVRRILLERPDDALSLFEDYSWRLKYERTKRIGGLFRSQHGVLGLNNRIAAVRWRYLLDFLRRDKPAAVSEGEEGSEEEAPEENRVEKKAEVDEVLEGEESSELPKPLRNINEIMPPLHILLDFVNKAGVGYTREALVHLYMSIVKFARTKCFSSVSFWGKIVGLSKEYYLFEANLIPTGEQESELIISSDEEVSEGETSDEENAEEMVESISSRRSTKEPCDADSNPRPPSDLNSPPQQPLDEQPLKVVGEKPGAPKNPVLKDGLGVGGTKNAKGNQNTAENEFLNEEGEEKSESKESIQALIRGGIFCCDDIIKPPPKPLVEPEPSGEGTNTFVYYVSNNMGIKWHKLPDVTPEQIVLARKFQKYFTGHFNDDVESYPFFKWVEFVHLRAQIARITAATSIAPKGFYGDMGLESESNENDEDAEENLKNETLIERPSKLVENPNFVPLSIKELEDLSKWVHIRQYILPQGRCTWVKPTVPVGETTSAAGEAVNDYLDREGEESTIKDPDEVEEEVGEEEEDLEEKGPPILSPITKDFDRQSKCLWHDFHTSRLFPQCDILGIQNRNWPGAYTLTDGEHFIWIYCGQGIKQFHDYLPHDVPHKLQTSQGKIVEEPDPDIASQNTYAKKSLKIKKREDKLKAVALLAAEEEEEESAEDNL